jgi:hypothetical protein
VGKKDLKAIIVATAVVGLLVSLAAAPFSSLWAMRYFLVSSLALVNWIALSAIFGGLLTRQPLLLIAGLMAKPLIILLFLVLGKQQMIEITSLLAGVNTFFVVVFGYLGWMALAKKNNKNSTPVSEAYG